MKFESFSRIFAISAYELKWDIKKKKVLFAISLSIISLLIIAIAAKYLLGGNYVAENKGIMWDNILLIFTNGLVSGIFPLILGSTLTVDSIAWEFDKGTILPLLSQPVKRSEVYFGKLLEKIFVILIISFLIVLLSLLISYIIYGNQKYIFWVLVSGLLFSIETLTYVSLSFLLGSALKTSGIIIAVNLGLYFATISISSFLAVKDGIHLWLTLFPLSDVNFLEGSLQQYFLNPRGKTQIGMNIAGILSKNGYLTTYSLLLAASAFVLLYVIAFSIIGYIIFNKAEIRG